MKEHGNNLFVTGIDTGIGKTVVSAILCAALQADYWKPVQCGDLGESDSMRVQALTGLPAGRIHPEAYRLGLAQSPHTAAAAEGVDIRLNDISLPTGDRRLVVEGAGGVLVPLNQHEWVIDLAVKFALGVVVVSQSYLGSLNHTFMTIETIRRRGLYIHGLVFNGKRHEVHEDFVAQRTDLPILLRVAEESTLNSAVIAGYAAQLQGVLR